MAFDDVIAGHVVGAAADVVLRRNDGVPAYNLAVVVDDAAAGIDLVVRGDDLLSSTPSQLAIGRGPRGARAPLRPRTTGGRRRRPEAGQARRGDTLAELADHGVGADAVRSALGVSIGLAEVGERVTADQLVDRFDVAMLLVHSSGPVHFDELVALIEQVVG